MSDGGVAFRDGEVEEERVVGAAGGGVGGEAGEGACDERGGTAAAEEGELFVERGVAEFGPWLETGEAAVAEEEDAFEGGAGTAAVRACWGAEVE